MLSMSRLSVSTTRTSLTGPTSSSNRLSESTPTTANPVWLSRSLFRHFSLSLSLLFVFDSLSLSFSLSSPSFPLPFSSYQKSKQLLKKKDEGNKAFKEGHIEKAHTLYSEALSIDPVNTHTNAKLYCNRALVGSKVRIGIDDVIFQ